MRVTREVLSAIAAHARRDSPRECCGLLVGTDDAIANAVPCENVAPDPARRYVIAPEELFEQIKACRSSGGGLRVVGAYHSHARSAPAPSPTDTTEACSGFLYLIAGPADGSVPLSVKAYELVTGNLREVALVTDAEEYEP